MDTLGQRIQLAREFKGISQKELCDILAELGKPIDPSYLSLLETDKRQPSIRTLAAVAVALGVDGTYLLDPIKEIYGEQTNQTQKIPEFDAFRVDPVLLSILLKSRKSLRLGIVNAIDEFIDTSEDSSESDKNNGN